jgi:hypothetical protein
VCLLLQDLVQSCVRGEGGDIGGHVVARDDEPRPLWTSLPVTHRREVREEASELCVCVFITCVCMLCLLLQDLVQSCARGGRRIVEDMCYEIRRAEACVD